VAPFDGDMDDYRRLVSGRRQADRAARRAERVANGDSSPAATINRKDQRRAAAQARAALTPLRKRAAKAEATVKKLSKEKESIEARLADPSLYVDSNEKVTELQKSLRDVERRIDAAEHDWLEAHEALEGPQGRD